MRNYRWGFEGDSMPRFTVEVPDTSELAAATTEYEVADVIPGVHNVRVITVKLVFIDDLEDSEPDGATRHPSHLGFPPGALRIIDKEEP